MSATYYPKKAGLSPIAYIVERNLKYELRVAYNNLPHRWLSCDHSSPYMTQTTHATTYEYVGGGSR